MVGDNSVLENVSGWDRTGKNIYLVIGVALSSSREHPKLENLKIISVRALVLPVIQIEIKPTVIVDPNLKAGYNLNYPLFILP